MPSLTIQQRMLSPEYSEADHTMLGMVHGHMDICLQYYRAG